MRILYLLAVCVPFFLMSCVSQKKYDALSLDKARLMRENMELKKTEQDFLALRDEMADLNAQYASAKNALDDLQTQYAALQNARALLQKQYNALLDENKALLATTSEEKAELTRALNAKQEELDAQEKQLRDLEESLSAKEIALAEREKSIAELNSQLQLQRNAVDQLRSRINEALLGFSAADLSVTEKDGKLYVSMSQNLLFAKDSDKLDWKGKQALSKLAEALNSDPDFAIMVEGHTDTDGSAAYNWDLSVSRATTVVKALSDYGVDQKRITAAGRAFFDPVATNENEDGKSKNRRTEIILSPNLDALYRLLDHEDNTMR